MHCTSSLYPLFIYLLQILGFSGWLRYSSLLDGHFMDILVGQNGGQSSNSQRSSGAGTSWNTSAAFRDVFSEFKFAESFWFDSGNHHLNSYDTPVFVMLSHKVSLKTSFSLSQVLAAEKIWSQLERMQHLIPLCSLPFVRECDSKGVMQKWILAEGNKYESGRSE